MNKDWMKRTASLSHQASTFRSQSDTTGYKTYGEDIELTVRHRQGSNVNKDTLEHQFSNELPTPSLEISPNGSNVQPRKIEKSFQITIPLLTFNLTITEPTKHQQSPVYYAVSSEFNPKQPDIVLYEGGSKNGNRLAVAHFRFSRHIRMGIGAETLGDINGTWEEMRNTSTYMGHWRYEFDYNVPDEEAFTWRTTADVPRTRKKFRWERTRDEIDGVKGFIEQYVGWRNYKLVEQGSERVLAVMLASMFTACTSRATINLHEVLPKEMEQVVVLTAACIFAKGERRTRRYHMAHTGCC